MINTKESGLEERIESDLINFGGYTKFDGIGYNRIVVLQEFMPAFKEAVHNEKPDLYTR